MAEYRTYTALPDEYLEEMEELTDEEYGRLIRALQRYHIDGTIEELPGNERFFLKRVINREDRFIENLTKTVNRNRVNGAKGGRPKKTQENPTKPNETQRNPVKPKKTQENPNKPNETQRNPSITQKTESESDSESKTNNNIIESDKSLSICGELEKSQPKIIGIPLVDGSEFWIYEADLTEWKDAYPAIDVERELKAIRQWCISNPKNRKTQRGARRFVTAWLERSQNRARPTQSKAKQDFPVRDIDFKADEAEFLTMHFKKA